MPAYALNTVEVYNPKQNTWTVLPEESFLQQPRAYFKLCELNDKLYAIGGGSCNPKAPPLNSVEVFSLLGDQTWKYIEPMKRGRSSHGKTYYYSIRCIF